MFANLAGKAALKKIGLSSKDLDFTSATNPYSAAPSQAPRREPNKLRKAPPPPRGPDEEDEGGSGWGGWLSVKSLPLTVHPWLAPPKPPVEVARVPGIGDSAPTDREGRLQVGGGRKMLVVFLRCVGCAFAQKTFLNLRTMANRYSSSIHCIAISHSSSQATKKWLDMIGGPWNVQVIIDEDRSLYATWGLGLGNVWYLFNPTTQIQGWKEKGWLGEKVAGAIQKSGIEVEKPTSVQATGSAFETAEEGEDEDGVMTVMGSKWQESGAFAVDGRGVVIWGGKALRADDVMDVEEGAKLLIL